MTLAPVADTRAELLRVWRDWDDACEALAGPQRVDHGYRGANMAIAAKAEVAFGNHGAHFGLRTTPFRDVLMAWRRAGFTREQALTATELGLGGIQ